MIRMLRHRAPSGEIPQIRIEADHAPIKQLCRATLGFLLEPRIAGEVRFVANLFGVCA